MGVLEIYNRQNPIRPAFLEALRLYVGGIDVERVGIDDRRIATGALYERMKHMAWLSLSDMQTLTLGFQHTARQQESADRLCGKDGTTGIIGTDDEPYKT